MQIAQTLLLCGLVLAVSCATARAGGEKRCKVPPCVQRGPRGRRGPAGGGGVSGYLFVSQNTTQQAVAVNPSATALEFDVLGAQSGNDWQLGAAGLTCLVPGAYLVTYSVCLTRIVGVVVRLNPGLAAVWIAQDGLAVPGSRSLVQPTGTATNGIIVNAPLGQLIQVFAADEAAQFDVTVVTCGTTSGGLIVAGQNATTTSLVALRLA